MAELAKLERVKILCAPELKSEVRDQIVNNLSGVVVSHQGKYLWLGTDELTAIERFTLLEDGGFGKHARFEFKKFIDDFDEDKGEVDVEGIDYCDGFLWIIGSHSSKRKKVKIARDKFQVERKELKQIERQENRYLLARIPVNEAGDLEAKSPKRAWLKRHGSNNSLTKALAKDEYLDLPQIIAGEDNNSLPGKEFYFYLPSKENGLDIEGLAVRGNKVFIGLRGPVLRGIAILLEIEVEAGSSNQLNLKAISDNGREYKRHFLELDGLGIRELCFEGDSGDLLILAGPTMDHDGAHSLFRLKQPLTLKDNSLSSQKNEQLEYLGDIPHSKKRDRAEGLTLYGGANSILVVYDSPAEERLIAGEGDTVVGVYADVFPLLRARKKRA
ncbi:DUF3616 domain-containing protein [Microseira wollei]|uniref:DUF3616 domain-containing protein n=1 Tax=Microseira wollei NIES-4236 TaxID=2530354 RepID=A0AAV3XEI3_9CYAN|nr:DUF3616 domain-containing protein [Microseira wollei]GET39891.1 hypothetical protein MiSe_46630 [Microseira wollei NIES-4236]